jgi:hypothetical protein
MILCYCCEKRLGHSVPPCECSDQYCPQCLVCVAHCGCDVMPDMVVKPSVTSLTVSENAK